MQTFETENIRHPYVQSIYWLEELVVEVHLSAEFPIRSFLIKKSIFDTGYNDVLASVKFADPGPHGDVLSICGCGDSFFEAIEVAIGAFIMMVMHPEGLTVESFIDTAIEEFV